MRAPSLLPSVLVALALAACGRSTLYDPTPPNGDGGVDAQGDGRVDGGPDVPVLTDARDVPVLTDARDVVPPPDGPPAACMVDGDCAGSPATPHCDVTTNRCVECVTSPQCGAGASCLGNRCIRPCSSGCSAGTQCCNDLCLDVRSDTQNCGGCNVRCPGVVNGTPGCNNSVCGIGACLPGFADCDGSPRNGCEATPATDNANCGACGNRCPAGSVCSGGTCAPQCGSTGPCPRGASCCSSSCAFTQTDPNNCGACNNRCPSGSSCVGGACTRPTTCPTVPCAAGSVCCAGVCVPDQSDPLNCGACNVRCSAGTPVCMNGACCSPPDGGTGVCGAMACPGMQTNCGGTCRDTQSDTNNCGACDVVCAAGQSCRAGRCVTVCGGTVCSAGQQCCNNACTDTSTDLANCGTCNNACASGPNSTPTCAGSRCGLTCGMGFGDCNRVTMDGCESNLLTDTANCGGCGMRCPPGNTCTSGRCMPMMMGCNGGPACGASAPTCCAGTGCANTTSDAANCGACANACAFANAAASCAASTCVLGACNAGFGNCNMVSADGCETNLQTDNNNCGSCGMRCPAGQACSMGTCAAPSNGSEGAFLPTVNPTYLTPGVHNFTTITVPAGSTVYVAGAGPAAGTLDLRATGHIQIDGIIDVSGGPGTQAVVASSSTRQGRAGTGGYTGEVRSADTATMNCEFAPGASGSNGPSIAGTSGTCTALALGSCLTMMDMRTLIFASPAARFGGGAGVFSGYRAYGAGGGGYAGGAPGALGATFMGERDCTGASAGGGATAGRGGQAMASAVYNGGDGSLGQTQCDATMAGIPRAWVGGGGGGSIGTAAASDLAAASTFYPGSGGGGGSADYLQRPAFGGTSGGGGGGGVLRLWTTADIVVNGTLRADGGRGGDAYLGTPAGAGCDPQPGAAGGGGSGGLLYLIAPSVTTGSRAVLSAAGGRGGDASVFATGGAGGAGGTGRIRLSVSPATCSLAGSFTPPLAAGCAATSMPGRTFVAAYPN